MRLWSLHPQYLDRAGLVALWREGLLAQAVLAGRTRGYRHHPQLVRFREQPDPVAAVAHYLHAVADEAERRGYTFDRARLAPRAAVPLVEVAEGQLRFEWRHLKGKLWLRDRGRHRALGAVVLPAAHPAFIVVPGPPAAWERNLRRSR